MDSKHLAGSIVFISEGDNLPQADGYPASSPVEAHSGLGHQHVLDNLYPTVTAVYKITVGHQSISDQFTKMTAHIATWSVLPSEH